MEVKDMAQVQRALAFAARAHDGQTRKGTDVPYIVHPAEAGMLLLETGAETDVVIAGILHDTLEDTDVTPNDISSLFGLRVLGIVKGCSEDKTKSWEERKSHTANYMKREASYEELLVCCADKVSNLLSIAREKEDNGAFDWTRFKRGEEKQRHYYESLLDALEGLADHPLYMRLEEIFNEVFG